VGWRCGAAPGGAVPARRAPLNRRMCCWRYSAGARHTGLHHTPTEQKKSQSQSSWRAARACHGKYGALQLVVGVGKHLHIKFHGFVCQGPPAQHMASPFCCWWVSRRGARSKPMECSCETLGRIMRCPTWWGCSSNAHVLRMIWRAMCHGPTLTATAELKGTGPRGAGGRTCTLSVADPSSSSVLSRPRPAR
jgi:hypothetical protein